MRFFLKTEGRLQCARLISSDVSVIVGVSIEIRVKSKCYYVPLVVLCRSAYSWSSSPKVLLYDVAAAAESRARIVDNARLFHPISINLLATIDRKLFEDG